jgi:hypothetical protein
MVAGVITTVLTRDLYLEQHSLKVLHCKTKGDSLSRLLHILMTKSYRLLTCLLPCLIGLEVNLQHHLSEPDFVTVFDGIRTMGDQTVAV